MGNTEFINRDLRKAKDPIRPSHYLDGRKYEPKDVIRDWDLNFNLGNAVKYIARAGKKDDIIQDLKKAKTYLEFEIDYLKEKKSEEEDEDNPFMHN